MYFRNAEKYRTFGGKAKIVRCRISLRL